MHGQQYIELQTLADLRSFKLGIDTINSPDDGHMAAQNM